MKSDDIRHNTKSYCTLFDSVYADKGLVMLNSIRQHNFSSPIYVLCMDEMCRKIISGESIEKVFPINLSEFLDDDLIGIRDRRTKGEFCWSCTGKLIKYVIDNYDCDSCTYLDSDLFFYDDPEILVDEMIGNHCSVQVVPHRFPNTRRWRLTETTSGKNCVQFNTFSREENSLNLLNIWIGQCIEKCDRHSGGDQIYTSNWGNYSFVYASLNDGAGLAPWNIENYKSSKNKNRFLRRSDSQEFTPIFYHFAGIEYLDRYVVDIHIRNKFSRVDSRLIEMLYVPYLLEIEKMKSKLEKEYGILPMYSHNTGLYGNDKMNLNLKQQISRILEKRNRKKDTIDISGLI